MQIPVWFKPAAWGAVVGIVAMTIIAFSAGWIVTGSGARQMAEREADQAVIAALTPVCVAKFRGLSQTQQTEHLAALGEESRWSSDDYVEEQGWATMPGAEEPNDEVADACATELRKLAQK